VKELGPGSAADGKAAEANPAVAAGAAAGLSPQKSDLALLHNANVCVSCHRHCHHCRLSCVH